MRQCPHALRSIGNGTSRDVRGLNIVELVVVLIIMSLLTLVLTPVVVNRARGARIRAAQQDIEAISEAERRAVIDTGFYIRIYALNDIAGPGDGIPNEDPNDVRDALRDITISVVHTTPEKIFIRQETQDFDANFVALFARLVANETAFNWHGPYIAHWPDDVNGNDWPDDPWGNDYIFFTRVGGLFARSASGPGGVQDDQFVATSVDGADALRFDRPAILSMGPDGLPGNGAAFPNGDGIFGTGDDLFRLFGGG